jgi:S-adenosylmethionine hydrolase
VSGPLVTLLSDFGHRDAYVGVMKARILAAAPHATIVDLAHEIPPQDVHAAAYVLETAFRWFPNTAIHVAVVDPGVGTERAAVAVWTTHGTFVAPDNGLLTPIEEGKVQAAVRLETPPGSSATFHGRDVFAPAAGRLAAGDRLAELGEPVEELVVLDDYRSRWDAVAATRVGRILHVDRFGNAITSIRREELPDTLAPLRVRVAGHDVGAPRQTYADVAPGEPLALFGSSEHLEIAVREGHAVDALGLPPGAEVVVARSAP